MIFMMHNSLKWPDTPQKLTFEQITRHAQAPSPAAGVSFDGTAGGQLQSGQNPKWSNAESSAKDVQRKKHDHALEVRAYSNPTFFEIL